jgi:hypothetical protein
LPRHFHAARTVVAAGLLLAAGLSMAACQTVSPADYKARSDELAAARAELDQSRLEGDRLSQDLATAQTRTAAAEKKSQAQENQIKNQEETISRLQGLLNDLHALQLDKVVPRPVAAEVLTTSTGQPVDGAAPPSADWSTGTAVANPAGGPPEPLALERSAGSAVAAAAEAPAPMDAPETVTVAPSPAPLAALDTDIAPAATLTLAPAKAVPAGVRGKGLGNDILNRVERAALRGTPLFSERDSADGRYYYYHLDAWYDRPGLFMEFSRRAGSPWSARLVIQVADARPAAAATDCVVSLNGRQIGPAIEARPLNDGSRNYQFVSLEYNGALAGQLRQALDSGSLSLAVSHPDGSSSAPLQPDATMRQALRDMLDAREDLR